MSVIRGNLISVSWLPPLLFCLLSSLSPGQDLPSEEAQDYYAKWLKEDVKYIITPEEKSVFLELETADEKEQFIEQFWFRRDPDPRTSVNEFREEHYRRIAHANDNFQSGWPGWMTDRGRIYIIHGEPVEIERHPAGERYDRPLHEGGGTTSTYAYEVWRYRSIDGIGEDVLVEFVDDSFTGEFRLSTSAQQKDALLHIAEQGLTLTEQMGGSNDDRDLTGIDPVTFGMMPPKETLFRRMEIYRDLQRPQDLQYKDLQRFVTVDVSYDQLPIAVGVDYLKLTESRAIVPVSVEIAHKDLSFVETNGQQRAGIILYGLVTGLDGKVVAEFEHDLAATLPAGVLTTRLKETSLYQKILVLDSSGRYKLDLIVQDVNGSNVGVKQVLLLPGRVASDKLQLSSIILADRVQLQEGIPDPDDMFMLGDVQVVPNIRQVFREGEDFQVYFQVYGIDLDQGTLEPDIEVDFEVLYQNRPIVQISEESAKSLYTFSSSRLVVIRRLPVRTLPAGKYLFRVRVRDRISDQVINAEEEFQIESG